MSGLRFPLSTYVSRKRVARMSGIEPSHLGTSRNRRKAVCLTGSSRLRTRIARASNLGESAVTVLCSAAFHRLQTRGERLRPPKSCKDVHFVDWIVDQEFESTNGG